MDKRRMIAVALLAVALVMATMGAVNAQLITTNVLRAWDDATLRYENGNMTLHLNAEPETFYTQLDFNTDLHPDACGAGTDSRWAGDSTIGLYHVDNSPAGAPGFQSTNSWKLVKCSAFTNPGTGKETIKFPTAADILAECIPGGNPGDGPCVLFATPPPDNVETAGCGGNCASEIVTRFHINIDAGTGGGTACDETNDPPFAGVWDSNPQKNNLCLYWEAVKPPVTPANQAWGGNIQVRYGTLSGGDKTINFGALKGPNAVNLTTVAAVAEANGASLAVWAGAMGLAALGLWVWRRKSAQ